MSRHNSFFGVSQIPTLELVQTVTNITNSDSNFNVTIASPKIGSAIVLAVMADGASGATAGLNGVALTGVSSFSKVGSVNMVVDAWFDLWVGYKTSSSGDTTIQCTPSRTSGARDHAIVICEFFSPSTNDAASGTDHGTGTNETSASITPSKFHNIVVCGWGVEHGSSVFSGPTNGFTIAGQDNDGGASGGVSVALCYKIRAGQESLSTGITKTQSSSETGSVICALTA